MTPHAATSCEPDEVPLLRLRSLADLIEAIPYLLGFHPTASLVVVMLHGADPRVGATLRYDLPDESAAGAAVAIAQHVAVHASLHVAERAVLVVFGDQSQVADGLPGWPLVNQVRIALTRSGASVVDAAYVCGRRWWSYLCPDPQCCPAGGRPLPARGATPSPIAAAAARAGLVALPDRAALSRILDPVGGSAREAMERALAEAEAAFIQAAAAAGGMPGWRAATRTSLQAVLGRPVDSAGGSGPAELTEADIAEFLVALSDLSIRDYCWLTIEKGGGPDDTLALWSQLVRRAVPPYDAAPLFLLGWAAWRHGDGILARMAAERALLSESDYGAARLLLNAVRAGIDPRELPDLGSGRPATRRAGGRRRR